MKLEVDLEEVFNAFCEEIRVARWSFPSLDETKARVYKLADVSTRSCDDVAEVILHLINSTESAARQKVLEKLKEARE